MHTRRVQPCHCVVCAAPLRTPPLDAWPACGAVACRMVVARRADMGDVAFGHYLRREVQQKREHRAREAALSARRAAETAENAGTWAALRTYARLPDDAPGVLQLLIPCGPRRARPVGPVRRARYRAHLAAVAAAAAALAPGGAAESADAASAASSMPGRLCGLCGGGCCTRGAEHAYLSPPILRRFMDAHPRLSPDEVVAAYLDRLSVNSQAGSCINHTRAGCSLPRAMRSDICNDFACTALAQLQAAQSGPDAASVVLVVRRGQDQWQRDRPDLANPVNGAAVLRETGAGRMRMR